MGAPQENAYVRIQAIGITWYDYAHFLQTFNNGMWKSLVGNNITMHRCYQVIQVNLWYT